MDLDDHVCLCFRVSRRKLENYVRLHRPKVASQLSECGGAGTGCGWCVPFLKQIFRQYQAECAAGCASCQSTPDDALDAITAEEYAALRAEYVKSGKGTPPPGAEPVE